MRQQNHPPPQGALRRPDRSVVWRVWAPAAADVSLIVWTPDGRDAIPMKAEKNGFFSHRRPRVEEGLRYVYKLSDGREYPDPASRRQPEGVHHPSAVFFPDSFEWTDAAWRGVAREDLAIYELHVGTFTPEGTLDAIVPRLPELLSLGVTAIELMPAASFAGGRNWGYDAVYPFAVQESYGGPRALQRLVDAAHRAGMAVLLDVVYNHLGPEGNYLGSFGPYFTDRYRTPWGGAVNFDGPDSDPVRQYAIDNARTWVRDFHVDGLRLDAVHAIFDLGPRHILADIKSAVRREAARAGRAVHIIAESDLNDVRLIRPAGRGGYGLDGVWSDDFHHAVHALLTGERDGYYLDFGTPAQVAKALCGAFVFDGCYSPFRRRRHGARTGTIDRTRFVVCIQNHDQVGNRALGERLSELVSPAAQRLACGLLMLSPCVPLLFMGEEYGEERPFPFFCSFDDPAVVEAVRRGRREEFAALDFKWGAEIPDPQAPETFAAAKLSWRWPAGSPQAKMRQLYADLLAARRRWPALRDRRRTRAWTVNGPDSQAPALLLIERGGEEGILAVANVTADAVSIAQLECTAPVTKPRPPVAPSSVAPSPVADGNATNGRGFMPGTFNGRMALLSTEDGRYGGLRKSLPSPFGRGAGGEEILFPHELIIFDFGGGPA